MGHSSLYILSIVYSSEAYNHCAQFAAARLGRRKQRAAAGADRYTLMKILITFIFLIFSAAGFTAEAVASKYKQSFLSSYSVIKSDKNILIKEKFGSHKSLQAINGLNISSKPDKHINTQYKIINIEGGRLKIEFTQTEDLRSFGGRQKEEKGIFYVSYK